MKWVLSGLGAFCLVVAAVLLVLAKKGVMIRPQPLIKPTLIQSDFTPVGEHVFLRLFPELHDVQVILLRWDSDVLERERFLQDFAKSFKSQLHGDFQIFLKEPSVDDVSTCLRTCLFILAPSASRADVERVMIESGRRWISIKALEFAEVPETPENCLHQQMLSEDCLSPVALNLTKKKLSKTSERVFFLYKYLDHDFFLFLRKPVAQPSSL
jgi:hypothetical protein